MEWIHREGFHAITLGELFGALELGRPLPPKPVLITFDDGYRDVLWNAAPILHRLHMPAVAFVITGRISGPDSSFLTWPELIRMEGLGFAIESHTVHHLELTLLPPGEAAYELEASRRSLEAHLHRIVQFFAYPAGRFDGSIESLVRRAGYVLALTTLRGSVQRADQPFLLRRYGIYSWTGLKGIEGLLG